MQKEDKKKIRKKEKIVKRRISTVIFQKQKHHTDERGMN